MYIWELSSRGLSFISIYLDSLDEEENYKFLKIFLCYSLIFLESKYLHELKDFHNHSEDIRDCH